MITRQKEETIGALATELTGITADGRFMMYDGHIEESVDQSLSMNEKKLRRSRTQQRERMVSLLRALVDDGTGETW
jgi:hypothetical protein